MKRFIFLFLFTLTLPFGFVHCDSCRSELLGYKEFTQSDLSIIPYNGSETLIFKDSLNDTMSFSNGKRYSTYTELMHEHPENYDCLGNYYRCQTNYTSFIQTGGHGSLDFRLFFYDIFHSTDSKYFSIQLYYAKSDSGSFSGAFLFNQNNILETNPNYGNSPDLTASMVLGPKTFSMVYTFKFDNQKIIYYSFSKGVVGFKTAKGHLWYLAN
jgi:hypothetical protein